MDKLWQRLIQHWRSENVNVPPGADVETIARFEAEQGVRLPEDLRGYFRAADGTGDSMDGSLYRFWPLKELWRSADYLRNWISDVGPNVRRLVFCDYCIDCWAYVVEVRPDAREAGPVYCLRDDPLGELMAATFREFISKYLADPDSVI